MNVSFTEAAGPLWLPLPYHLVAFQQPCLQSFAPSLIWILRSQHWDRSWKHFGFLLCLPRLLLGCRPAPPAACLLPGQPPAPMADSMLTPSCPTLSGLHSSSGTFCQILASELFSSFRAVFLENKYYQFLSFPNWIWSHNSKRFSWADSSFPVDPSKCTLSPKIGD